MFQSHLLSPTHSRPRASCFYLDCLSPRRAGHSGAWVQAPLAPVFCRAPSRDLGSAGLPRRPWRPTRPPHSSAVRSGFPGGLRLSQELRAEASHSLEAVSGMLPARDPSPSVCPSVCLRGATVTADPRAEVVSVLPPGLCPPGLCRSPSSQQFTRLDPRPTRWGLPRPPCSHHALRTTSAAPGALASSPPGSGLDRGSPRPSSARSAPTPPELVGAPPLRRSPCL